jgi:simple sugar transport system ATP-binding protein
MAIAIKMEKILKTFPGVIANNNISLEVRKGEIHALLGENGAGKSTLMNILFGISRPDSGSIYIDEKPVKINSPKDAIANGIGMIHQHFMLIPVFTVAENILLGEQGNRKLMLDLESTKQKITTLGKACGLQVDPDVRVRELSVGEQQRVEIIKALYHGATILIMDEPTSVLTPQETHELFILLKNLAEEGNTILFITHKLKEVMEISDRVTILRNGKVVGTVATKDTNQYDLAKMMVGREILTSFEKKPSKSQEVVLELNRISADRERGLSPLKDISFKVHAGEIVGVAGVDGNGQNELVDVIMGMRPVTGGEIAIKGKSIKDCDTKQIIDMGVSCIPFLRQTEGLVMSFTLSDALLLKEWDNPPFVKNGFWDQTVIDNFGKQMIRDYNIKATGIEAKVATLSGGNQQKVVLARELSREPKLVIACHPTHGLDIGATEYVRLQLIKERDRGAAVMLISTELDEILQLCDRIVVLFNGEVMGEVTSNSLSIEDIGLMMLGVDQDSVKMSVRPKQDKQAAPVK